MKSSNSITPMDNSIHDGETMVLGYGAAKNGGAGEKRVLGSLSSSFGKSILFLLAISAFALSVATFAFSRENARSLEEKFVEYADQIAQHFHMKIYDQLLALDSFGIAATSHALHSGQSWPNVTIPDFAIRAWTARQQMEAETLGFIPVVRSESRQEWEAYVVENHSWIHEARAWEAEKARNELSSTRQLLLEDIHTDESAKIHRHLEQEVDFSMGVASSIYVLDENGKLVVDEGLGPYAPLWMMSPTPREAKMINYNLLSHNLFWEVIETCIDSRLAVLSQILNLETTAPHKTLAGSHTENAASPISALVYPVFETFEKRHEVVAILTAEVRWTHYFENSLPSNVGAILCVIESACDQQFSIMIEGNDAVFLGSGDYHDPKYTHLVQTRRGSHILEMAPDFAGYSMDYENCPFLLHMYPTTALQEDSPPGEKLMVASGLFCIFVTVIGIASFHKAKTDDKEHTFPTFLGGKNGPTRILRWMPNFKRGPRFKGGTPPPHFKAALRALPDRITLSNINMSSSLNATVMFADVRGLGTWKNGKSDEEVSNLTETVHRSLNVIAKRYGIHHVGISDGNYVTVLGSDGGHGDHAAILVLFACECRKKTFELFKSMSARDISMRFGVHSGYVHPDSMVAGAMVDGQFNLFGETIDVAHQIMLSGKPNRIHISVETAELLNLSGKSHWLSPRSETVLVNGKGEISTYWIKPKVCLSARSMTKAIGSTTSDSSIVSESTVDESEWDESNISRSLEDGKLLLQRLVDQNVDILLGYLRGISARRLVLQRLNHQTRISSWEEEPQIGVSMLEEAQEAIQAPTFDLRLAMNAVEPALLEIPSEVESQLRNYVSSIATAYRQTNPFHSFEHASHVVRTMDQMIKKMTSSSDVLVTGFDGKPRSAGEIAKEMDQKTFSIASDPLLQFTLVFAALVHDVDHIGVSNQQLIKESSPIASLYKNRSVSEQNAVDISWWLLMTADFEKLRSAIYTDTTDMRRFRQCLVNCVIATDILDRTMKDHRDYNWNKCFVRRTHFMDWDEKRNLQATAVAEALMQAADAGHCLQPFRSYLKWNERLFDEMYQAYHAGRADIDPSTQWYQAELAFFDKFLIPLLTRLKQSGVFGGYGEAYLKNATDNRDQWKAQGPTIVREMMDEFSRRVVAAQDDIISFT